MFHRASLANLFVFHKGMLLHEYDSVQMLRFVGNKICYIYPPELMVLEAIGNSYCAAKKML